MSRDAYDPDATKVEALDSITIEVRRIANAFEALLPVLRDLAQELSELGEVLDDHEDVKQP